MQEISNLGMCEACRSIVQKFPKAAADQWTMEGGRYTFTGAPRLHAFIPSEDGTEVLAQVIIPFSISKLMTRKPDGTIYRADDVLGSEEAHHNVAYSVTVRWGNPWKGRWIFDDVKRWEP